MKKKHNHDYITEEDFTLQVAKMAAGTSATDPQEDSPGDSEADAGTEFEVGLNFSADELEAEEEEVDAVVTSQEPADTEEVVAPQKKIDIDSLPDSAKVVFSEQPSPWRDLEKSSDVN